MKRITSLLVAVFFFSFLNHSYAFDWKRIHEEADKKSLAEAKSFLGKNPDSVEDLYILGLVYLNIHKDKEAEGVFDRIMSLSPREEAAKWGEAEALRRQHRLEKSEELLHEVIKQEPDFSPAYVSLAYIEYAKTNFDKAIELASRVIQQGSDNVDLSNYVRAYVITAGSKGMIAHYGGPISKVINGTAVLPTLKKALSLQPDSAAVLFGLGSFYLLAPGVVGGDIGKALEFLEKAIKADPLFIDAYVRLAQVYKIKGGLQKYNLYLNQALELDPQNQLALDIKSGQCKFVCF